MSVFGVEKEARIEKSLYFQKTFVLDYRKNAFLGSDETRFALIHSPAQRRTMPTSHPNTPDFSNIAHQHDAGDAFAAPPAHVLITHVLSSRNLPDPSDLARLRAVSREMRDAVAATGRKVYELGAGT